MYEPLAVRTTFNNQVADNFIDEFCSKNEAETSKIIAGMVAIINGNEEIYEKMKKQKWFERIWYTITGKNKASVQEMQRNRDVLNKYLVQMIIRICEQEAIQAAQISGLVSTMAILDDKIRDTKINVGKIARKLNEKIMSLDNYLSITIDINNGKYPTDQPLLSLIDIASQLDSITVNDPKRLKQLKETMESSGFSFNSRVNVRGYAEQVLSLPEEKVGRIMLFCQSFSERSRFLAYTVCLIENYFYLGKTDRCEVQKSDEVIQAALRQSNLREDSDCVVEDMYTDLQEMASDRFSALSSLAEEANHEPAEKIAPKNSHSGDEDKYQDIGESRSSSSKSIVTIVYNPNKRSKYAHLLTDLIQQDGRYDAVEYTEKKFKDNAKKFSAKNKIIFLGHTYEAKKRIQNECRKNRFNEVGVHYGWFGNQAFIGLDPVYPGDKDGRKKFMQLYRQKRGEYADKSHEYDKRHNSNELDENKITKKSGVSTLQQQFSMLFQLPDISDNVGDLTYHQYNLLLREFVINGLEEFMEE